MFSPRTRGAVLLTVLLSFSTAVAMAQEAKKTIKRGAPVAQTSAGSGEQMFNTYCAVCHGKDGKGDGPAASEFKIPPANLTLLPQTTTESSLPTTSAKLFGLDPEMRRHTGRETCPCGVLCLDLWVILRKSTNESTT